MTGNQPPGDAATGLKLKTEVSRGFLEATVTGHGSSADWWEVFKKICEIAIANGLDKILVDKLAATDDVSLRERYRFGQDVAEHLQNNRISFKIAVLTKEPLTALEVSIGQNRGFNVEMFDDLQRALDWLLDPTKSSARPRR